MKTSAKDEVRALLEKLPDDASLNDIQYHIYVQQKIERGLDAIRKGEVIPRNEIKKQIWDSNAANSDAIPLTPSQIDELERRKLAHSTDPDSAKPWTEIRERLAKRKR